MISRSLLPVLVIFIFAGCHDDFEGLTPDPLFPKQQTFKSSLFIEVMDADHRPVSDALISMGEANGYTDASGFLFLGDITVGESSYLTVEKEGYFHASRRFYPSKDKSHHVKIMMLSNSRNAFFNSASGRTLSFNQVVTLNFPKDAYELKNGDVYEGVVIVSAQTIPANDADMSLKMPGDLVGINSNAELGCLASMGMVAVQLRTPAGELLQMKNNTVVKMNMKIPADMVMTAPSVIPMWYFNETEGIWREEGMANLVGDEYTAIVHHFSYWNYDAWFPATKWKGSFVFENGNPANNLEVCITIDALKTTKCAYTNEYGFVSGLVAADEALTMNVNNSCNEKLLTLHIGPFADSTVTGPITIASGQKSVIKGIALDCNGMPVHKAYVIVASDNTRNYSLSGDSGLFTSSILNCSNSDVSVSIIDYERLNYSRAKVFSNGPVIDCDTIEVCTDLKEFLTLYVSGIVNPFSFDSISFRITQDGYSLFQVKNGVDSTAQDVMWFGFEGYGPGDYPQAGGSIALEIAPEIYGYSEKMHLIITHFGEIGDFIQGSIQGDLYTDPGSANPSHTFQGNFSVFRDQ